MFPFFMPGAVVAGILVFLGTKPYQDVDGRDKPAPDDGWVAGT